MIRFTVFTILFFCFSLLSAEDLTFQNERSVYCYSKELGLSGQLRAVQDIVILKDGTLLQGEIIQSPSLKFSFGETVVSIEKMELLTTVSGKEHFIKLLTRENDTYIGRPESYYLAFKENRGDEAPTLLDLREVEMVLFKSRNPTMSEIPKTSLHVVLGTSEVFPVEISGVSIEVSDGWNTRILKKEQILNLEFNGGLYGAMIGAEGQRQSLPLSFSKEPTISFNVPIAGSQIRLPWDQIKQLCLPQYLSCAVDNHEFVESQAEVPLAIFSSNHPKDVIEQVAFLESPPVHFAAVETYVIPEVAFITAPERIFSANEDWNVPEISFSVEPLRLFSDRQELSLPKSITYIDESRQLFSRSSLDDFDKMFAAGEDFDFEGWDTPSEESTESADEVLFISSLKEPNGIHLAVGEIFEIKEEEESSMESEEDDEVEFLSVLDTPLAVGEDFDLNDRELETTEDLDSEDEVQFISRGYSSKRPIKKIDTAHDQSQLAYRECGKCLDKPFSDPMPHADFSMDDAPDPVEEEEESIEVLLPPLEIPEIPEEPQVYEPREGPSARINVSKIQTTPSFPYRSDPKTAPRAYDGLIYVNAIHADEAGFYIKPHKVTNSEYKKFVDAINYRTPTHWVGGAIPSGMEDEPVVNVTYRDAFLYSVWAGKRLPTEDELSIATELNVILTDRNDQSAEWTATPTLQSVKYPQSSNSVKIGRSFPPSHQVFSRYRVVSMNNDDSNNYTGFRTALEAH